MRVKQFLSALMNRPPPPRGPGDPPEGVSRESFTRGHETSDISSRGVFLFGVTLLGSLGVVLFAVTFGLKGVTSWEQRRDMERVRGEPGAASLVREPRAAPANAGPLLQVDPAVDLQTMRRDEAATRDTYGWTDRRASVVRLPIGRAMDLLAERGLPPVSPGKTMQQLQQERARPAARRGDDRPLAPARP